MSKDDGFSNGLTQRAFKVLLALILALGLSPLASVAAFADPVDGDAADEPTIEEQVDALLAAGEYAEGQALVVVNNGDGSASLAAQADDESEQLLAEASTLMQVDGRAVAEAAGEEAAATEAQDGAALAAEEDDYGIVLVKSDTMSTRELLITLIGNPRVVSAEPNYILSVNDEPAAIVTDEPAAELADEPAAALATEAVAQLQGEGDTGASYEDVDLTPYQWGFDNDTTNGYLSNPSSEPERFDGFDLGIDDWNGTEPNATGVVAVMDTGIDFENPDLANVMISNAQDYLVGTKYENSGASLDNGFDALQAEMDDTDVVEYTIMDFCGHGTHVAGIIGAEWNGYGTSGAANGIELIGVRAGDALGAFTTDRVISGYEYLTCAVEGGMRLVAVNNSWTSNSFSSAAVSIAVTELGERGTTSIFGSGNDAKDTDVRLDTPFSLTNNPYVVCVNAANYVGNVSDFSNWGINATNVYAPGTGILSTKSQIAKNGYTGMADPNALLQETFNDNINNVVVTRIDYFNAGTMSGQAPKADGSDFESFEITDGVTYEDSATIDSGSGSLRLIDNKLTEYGYNHVAAIYVKMSKDDAAKIKFQGMGIRNSGKVNNSIFLPIIRRIGDESNSVSLFITNSSKDETWNYAGSPVTAEGYELATVAVDGDDSSVYVPFGLFINRMYFEEGESDEALNDHFVYVDELCAGTSDTYWMFDSGTSMATPSITGCAAIIAKSQGTLHFNDRFSGVQAIERADILKGRIGAADVRDEAQHPCSQGGMVNMKVVQEDMTAVIHSTTVSSSGVLTIKGSWFGEPGSLKIDGEAVAHRLWDDASITADVSNIPSGTHELRIETANGKVTKRVIIFEVEASGTKAFPNELTPFDTVAPDYASGFPNSGFGMVPTSSCALDGKIYCTGIDQMQSTDRLFVYDTAADTWKQTAPFPVDARIGFASVVAYQGQVFASLWDLTSETCFLMAYDDAEDSWQSYDTSALFNTPYALTGTLVSANDKLLLIGGFDRNTGATYTENGILELTLTDEGAAPAIAAVTPVGDLAFGGASLKTTVRNGAVYVGNGNEGTVMPSNVSISSALQRLDYDGTTWNATDISASLPQILEQSTGPKNIGFGPGYGLAATSQGIVISGVRVDDGTGARAVSDTYILKDGSDSFEPLICDGTTYSASMGELIFPASIGCDGTLYTMGMSLYTDEETSMSFRSISLDETEVAVPTAQTGLTYTGAKQTGVAAAEGFTVTGGSATNAGTYTATATLQPGFVWTDGDYDAKQIDFTIKPASISKATIGTIAKQTYTGKAKTPSVSVTLGKSLKKGTDFTVTYKNNIKVGKATATVKGTGNYTGTKSTTFTIIPAGTSLTKVTPVSKGFTATWAKKTTQVTGYQIRYSTSSKMTSAKIATIAKNTTLSKKVTKLKAGTRYYVQVRTYKTIDGKKCVSKWSDAMRVTTLK